MPSTIIIRAKLDMTPGAVPTVVHRSQYDSDFTIIFELFARTGEFVIEQGTTARLRGTKSSGTGYSVPIPLDIAAKKVTITGDSQMTVAAGNNIFEVVLYVGDLEICSANFVLCVERAAMDMDTITDETVVPELERLDEYIEQAAEIAAREGAAYAESWAVGGTGKRPDEDTNNAKYWSDQAQGVVHGVNSFNGRNGAVVPVAGDYTTVTVTRNGDPVEDSLQEIEGDIGDLQTDLSGVTDRVDAAEDDIDTINNTTVPALQSAIDGKVDMIDALLNLDTTQASTTIDGALYEAITNNGWGAIISQQLMDLKQLLTNLANSTRYLPSYFNTPDKRPVSANIEPDGNATVRHFIATSSMTTGKPDADGNVLHFSWDGTRYASQLALLHGAAGLQYRYQSGAGQNDWTKWLNVYGDYTPFTSLTKTYTSNSYISQTAFNRIIALKLGRLVIVQGNLNIDTAAIPKSSSALAIGKIHNVGHMAFAPATQVPGGTGGTANISLVQESDDTDARVEIYNYANTSVSGWIRFNWVTIVNVM